MNLKKYNSLSDEEFKNLSDKEFNKFVEAVKKDFPMHHRKINEITIKTTLTPEEAIEIAKLYHKKTFTDPEKLNGTVNEDINQLLFDEAYTFKIDPNDRSKDDIRPAWRVTVDLPDNPFLMEGYTLIVSDKDKKVMGMLGPNGHPVFEGMNTISQSSLKSGEKE